MRSDPSAVTVWQLPRQRIAAAHGLLWSDGAPDLRDARIAVMKTSLQALSALQQQPDGPLHWLPEQGEMLGAQAPAGHRAYLETLERQADRAMEDGTQESDPPPAPEAAAMASGASRTSRAPGARRKISQAGGLMAGTAPAARSARQGPSPRARGAP